MTTPLGRSNQPLKAAGFRAIGWQLNVHSYEWSPPTDVYETDASFVVRVEVAGLSGSDFKINAEDNFLVISGVRGEPPKNGSTTRWRSVSVNSARPSSCRPAWM